MKRESTKFSPIVIAIAAVVASTGTANAETFTAKARVTNVEPITKQVAVNNPRQECWNEQVQGEQKCYYRDVPGSYQQGGYNNHNTHHSSNHENHGGHHDTYTYDNFQNGERNGRSHNGSVGGAVAGAAVGGVIGHQFGRGKGKTAATVGGAIIGALAGRHLAGGASANTGHSNSGSNNNHGHNHGSQHGSHGTSQPRREYVCDQPTSRSVRQCRTVNDTRYETRTTGYRVSYRFKGQDYTTTTASRPGRHVPVTVSVKPDSYNPNAYARVVSSTPITRQVRTGSPRQECYDKQVKGDDYCYYRNNGHTNHGYQNGHNQALTQQHYGHQRDRSYRADGSVGGTVAGAVIGGVAGAQFGRGKGKTAATVGGAILGAIAGHEISANHNSRGQSHSGNHNQGHGHHNQGQPSRGDYVCEPRQTTQRECRTVNDYRYETRTDGYKVTYKLKGRTFTTRTQTNPGRQLPVRLSVTPRI